jgi:hypothetical protein
MFFVIRKTSEHKKEKEKEKQQRNDATTQSTKK